MQHIKQAIKKSFRIIYYLFSIFPIKKNKIVVMNYFGRGYGDNPKYICEELLKTSTNLDIVWLVYGDLEKNSLPGKIRAVKVKTLKSVYEQTTAKVWIDNSRKQSYVYKRKNQFYIQTWHGGIPLKKIEFDCEKQFALGYINNMKNDNKMINLIISNSEYSNKLYRKTFRYKN